MIVMSDVQQVNVDIPYCASSYLMFRTVADGSKAFSAETIPQYFEEYESRIPVRDSAGLEDALREITEKRTGGKPIAVALSGGIDSAIVAKLAPKNSVAYTFKCVVPGVEVTDESSQARCYAQECGLEHKIVEVTWEDMVEYAPRLMSHKGAPIHSIEVQIYKAARVAASDGFDMMLFGESSDATYGGMDGLLSQDWTFGDFVDRYTHIMPYKVLKDWQMDLAPYEAVCQDGYIDAHEFVSTFYRKESLGSYTNATECAGMNVICPFAETVLDAPLDYERIRNGEGKYLVREVFKRMYPGWEIPKKTPMPRPTEEWMASWTGPERDGFWPHCTDGMTGDQKWMVWALEKYLNMIEG